MKYDRQAALAYARKYWNKACSDGYVGVVDANVNYRKVTAQTPYDITPNPQGASETIVATDGTTVSWKALFDCAHFVSCSLGTPPNEVAGGLPIKSDFPAGPYGCLGADRLYDQLKQQARLKLVVERKSFTEAQPSLSKLQSGDLIFYSKTATSPYGHVGIYMGNADKDIACHTYCRSDANNDYPQTWQSVSLPFCTLVQIIDP